MNAETVDDSQIEKYSRLWTTGQRVSFCETIVDTFGLQFCSGAKLEVFPTDAEDSDSEITIRQSDGSYYSFDFHRGWYLN